MSSSGLLRVAEIGRDRASLRGWLAAKRAAHDGHGAFVVPLALLEKRRLSPRHNPFFESGEAAFFVAERGGRPVGRISAQVQVRPGPGDSPALGHFGFFDVVDDPEAAHALLDAAAAWLAARGATAMRGPFSLSINEECGCQVEGFDLPSTYLMPQARPWTGSLLESWGLRKAMDMHAWRVGAADLSRAMAERDGSPLAAAGIRSRLIRMRELDREVALLADIFNDGWQDNWGFVPFSPRAVSLLAADLRRLYRPAHGFFVELHGRAVGTMISIPNVNEIIKPFGGRLTPVNLLRLVWTLARDGTTTFRIPIVGIRKEQQGGVQGAMILAALMAAAVNEIQRRPRDWFEFSWVLETNRAATAVLRGLGARRVSTYRIYERSL